METIINTIKGTYIVPANKLDQLLQWLESNAVRPGATPIGEINKYFVKSKYLKGYNIVDFEQCDKLIDIGYNNVEHKKYFLC